MRMRRQLVLFATLLPTCLHAQAPTYKAPTGEVFVATENPYRMYWLRGGDTIGSPTKELTLERQLWTTRGTTLEVLVDQQSLDAARRATSDTFVIGGNGRVETINAKPPGINGRVDFLLKLPVERLTLGTKWSDTLDHTANGVGGQHRYLVQRSYRVVSELDTLGHHVARVEATGTVDYRDGWWADSSKGVFYTIDVRGPVAESFLFDARQGQLVARSWKMDLRGRGIIPNERGGQDTLPAGLQSEERQWLVDPHVAHVIGRALPKGDTSLTFSKGLLFVHTVRRTADTIDAGFGRNGGLVGTARAVFSSHSPVAYTATWTDGFAPAQTESIEKNGDSLVVLHHGSRTVIAIPRAAWGIADYAMQELLVPVLLSVPMDGSSHPFAIYRPYAAHWDSGTVVIRPLSDARIALVQMTNDKKPQALLIANDGDYLYGENSDPIDANRVPSPNSVRRTKLQSLLDQLRSR